jgi:competence protein ComEC
VIAQYVAYAADTSEFALHVLTRDELAVLFGMSLGLRPDHSTLRDAFQRSGLTHMLVLSGSNISLLAGSIQIFLRRLPRQLRYLLGFLIPTLFVVATDPGPSTVRALLMFCIPTLVAYFGWETHRLYLLGLVCLCMLTIQPSLVSSISFQLSFAATLGIFLFYHEDEPKVTGSFLDTLRRYLASQTRLTFAAQAFTIPIIMLHFNTVSIVAPFANIFIAWMVAPIMIFGLLAAVFLVTIPIASIPFLVIAKPLLWLCIGIATFFAQFSFSQLSY